MQSVFTSSYKLLYSMFNQNATGKIILYKKPSAIILLFCLGTVSAGILPSMAKHQTSADTSTQFFKYLIIIPDNEDWLNTITPLIDWKTREGLHIDSEFPADCRPVKVTNLTEIASIYGSANAANIRRYIIDLWDNSSYSTGKSTLRYVLLAGDVNYIPTYLYSDIIDGKPLTYATDQYYADFYDPSMSLINPAIDKTDWNPEVYVGRFPVNNPGELERVVNKTVTYEMHSAPLQQGPPGWQRKTLFLGAILDNGYTVPGSHVWKDGAYVAELINQNCSDWWIGNTGPMPKPTTLYDTNHDVTIWPSGYEYLNDIHNLTTANIIDQINNEGASAVLVVSHGNLKSVQGRNDTTHSQNDWNPPFFENEDVLSLRNNYTLPFWFVDACNTGAFQADLSEFGSKCLGEELLLADPDTCGGAVGFIGCSNLSWYRFYYGTPQNRPDVLETLSDRLANLTFCQLYDASSPTEYLPTKWSLGAALFEAKRLYNETSWGMGAPNEMHMATCLGFNLLGDPSLQIWPEKPLNAPMFYDINAPSTVKTGEKFTVNIKMTVLLTGGSYPPLGPRRGAKVCISNTAGDYAWCAVNLTDSFGNVTFTAPAEPGIYNLTVVDHPYLVPYLSQITVVSPVHDVAVTNVTASEASINQGTSLAVNVTVENQGDETETINVTLYANQTLIQTENVTLPSNSSTIISFMWNTTSFTLGDYILKAEAQQVPDETDLSDNIYTADYTITVIPEYPEAITFLLMIPLITAALVIARQKQDRTHRLRH